MKRHGVTFWNHATRVYQVYDADRVCVGSWSARGLEHALVALAQNPYGRMLVCDERQGCGKWHGWGFDRVVSERNRRCWLPCGGGMTDRKVSHSDTNVPHGTISNRLNSATLVGGTRALHVTVDRRQAKPITLLDAAKCILFARREADLGPLERIEGHLARLNECIRRTDIELADLREILSAEGKV